MSDLDDEWGRKGATLSDKTACEEFGLTRDEIFRAIKAGELQYREASMHGNPWLRLLRREVEEFVKKKHGGDYLQDQKAKTELRRINRELKRLKAHTEWAMAPRPCYFLNRASPGTTLRLARSASIDGLDTLSSTKVDDTDGTCPRV